MRLIKIGVLIMLLLATIGAGPVDQEPEPNIEIDYYCIPRRYYCYLRNYIPNVINDHPLLDLNIEIHGQLMVAGKWTAFLGKVLNCIDEVCYFYISPTTSPASVIDQDGSFDFYQDEQIYVLLFYEQLGGEFYIYFDEVDNAVLPAHGRLDLGEIFIENLDKLDFDERSVSNGYFDKREASNATDRAGDFW